MRASNIFKRLLSLSLAISITAAASSCIRPGDIPQSEIGSTESISEEEDLFTDYIYNDDAAKFYSGIRAAVAEEGYFFEVDRTLFFYSITAKSLFPLCTKESCVHADKTCRAHIYDAYEGGDSERGKSMEDVISGRVSSEWVTNCCFDRVFYWEDCLYMISQKWDGSEVVYKYNSDFTEQKKIGEITRPRETPRVMAQDMASALIRDGWLYYLTFSYIPEQAESLHWMADYTLCRLGLTENASPEELFTISFPLDYDAFTASWIGFRILAMGDDIYCIGGIQNRQFENEHQVQQRVIRYSESSGAELLWEYTGDEKVNLFGAEGEGPLYAYESCLDDSGNYLFLSEQGAELGLSPTAIAEVNLVSQNGRVLYRTPYKGIEWLKTDGTHYFFLEHGDEGVFLTAIDSEGKMIRRYQFEYSEKFKNEMEQQGIPRNQWPNGSLMLMISDGRYLVIRSYNNNGGIYKELTITRKTDENLNTDGIGLILTEDFLNGKEVEIRQIY